MLREWSDIGADSHTRSHGSVRAKYIVFTWARSLRLAVERAQSGAASIRRRATFASRGAEMRRGVRAMAAGAIRPGAPDLRRGEVHRCDRDDHQQDERAGL